MKKIKYILLTPILGFLISCNSSKEITESKTQDNTGEDLKLIAEYIANDTIFINDLKNYFSDLNIADSFLFVPSNYIEFIPLSNITQTTLTQTSFYNEYKDLSFLEFKKFMKNQDSLNKFPSYRSKYINSRNGEINDAERKIYLKFSKRINNLVNIEYIIIDQNVDPRIAYTPRNGYYLVEFNDQNEIIKRFYTLRTIN